jgi:hypothetical protein
VIDFHRLLQQLASKRPVFHSEADFQLALGWEMHEMYGAASVRLEYRPFSLERFYVDVWASLGGQTLAIETKYWTRRLSAEVMGERFEVADRAAHDIMRYDFFKDLVRLERVVKDVPGVLGYAIALTNDSAYWKESLKRDSIDALFRIHEGRSVTGELRWSPLAGAGTTKGREVGLTLSGIYGMVWIDYSKVGSGSYSQFRYLLIRIGGGPSKPLT